jgi:hypothetical protein
MWSVCAGWRLGVRFRALIDRPHFHGDTATRSPLNDEFGSGLMFVSRNA